MESKQDDFGLTQAEQIAFAHLRAAGLQVFRHGWPDFLCVSQNGLLVRAVEVKGPGDSVRPHQDQVHRILAKAGIKVSVLRVDDLGNCDETFIERPARHDKVDIGKTASSDNPLDGFWTPAELCGQLNICNRTLARWLEQRTGPPFVKVGKRTLYRKDAVRDWLMNGERTHHGFVTGRRLNSLKKTVGA